jgi:hypothetical protein
VEGKAHPDARIALEPDGRLPLHVVARGSKLVLRARATLPWLAPIVPVLCALAVWHPLRHNYFVGDDFDHLYAVATSRLPSLLGTFWGGHLLLVYNAIYAGLFRLFGPDPRGYFWTMLLTHLVNTGLLFVVVRRFTGDRLLACAGAALWAVCPTLEGALGWFSVYGQVVLATIVLAVLASVGRHFEPGSAVSPGRAAAWSVALGLGSTCFGMGLGIAAVFPLVAALAVPRTNLPWRSMVVLVLGAAAAIAMYEIFRAYLPPSDVATRVIFSVASIARTSPEAVILTGHLLAFGTIALLASALGIDGRYPDVGTVAIVAVAAIAFLATWAAARPAMRRRVLALALLTVATVGSVGLGRATLIVLTKSSFAWAATRPRYHYLPLALLTALGSTALGGAAARVPRLRIPIRVGVALWTAAAVALLVTHPRPIQHWAEARADSEAFVRLVRTTVAATPPGAIAVIQNGPFGPKRATPNALIGLVGAFVIFFPEDTVDGRPVRFAVNEHDWKLAQERGGRVAGLVTRSGDPGAQR